MTTTDSNEEEETYSSQHGATVTIQLEDGRLDAEMSPTTIQVSPVEGERNMFYVRLRTSHYSFSIKNTCVVRSLQSFYQLRSILKTCHNYLTIPSLPLHASTWVSSYQSISSRLAEFLSQVSQQWRPASEGKCNLWLAGAESERTPLQQSPPSVPPVATLHGEYQAKCWWKARRRCCPGSYRYHQRREKHCKRRFWRSFRRIELLFLDNSFDVMARLCINNLAEIYFVLCY